MSCTLQRALEHCVWMALTFTTEQMMEIFQIISSLLLFPSTLNHTLTSVSIHQKYSLIALASDRYVASENVTLDLKSHFHSFFFSPSPSHRRRHISHLVLHQTKGKTIIHNFLDTFPQSNCHFHCPFYGQIAFLAATSDIIKFQTHLLAFSHYSNLSSLLLFLFLVSRLVYFTPLIIFCYLSWELTMVLRWESLSASRLTRIPSETTRERKKEKAC